MIRSQGAWLVLVLGGAAIALVGGLVPLALGARAGEVAVPLERSQTTRSVSSPGVGPTPVPTTTSAPLPTPIPTAPPLPTAEPTPVSAAEPQPAPATTAPTAALVQPAASLVPQPAVAIDERFQDNHAGWPNDPNSTAWLAGGAYHLAARVPPRFVAVRAPGEPIRDVLVTASFRKTDGPPGGGYGVIVRDTSERPPDGREQRGEYYVFEVGDKGEVGIWRRAEDTWLTLVTWTPSVAVHAGTDTNDLTVRAVGADYTFTVNGASVAHVQDTGLINAGHMGVFVGGDFNECELLRFVVQPVE